MPDRGISGPTASGAASSAGNSGEPAVRSSREPSMSTRYRATDETPAMRWASATICSPSRCGGTLFSTSATSSGEAPPLPSSPAGRSASCSFGVGGIERVAARDRDELAAAVEVPVDGGAADAGGDRDRVDAGAGILFEQPHCGLHDARVVLLCVRAPPACSRTVRRVCAFGAGCPRLGHHVASWSVGPAGRRR